MNAVFDKLCKHAPYSLPADVKRRILSTGLNELTQHHYSKCKEYKSILDGIGYNPLKNHLIEDLPLLPIGLFKIYDLISSDPQTSTKVITSSGTSNGRVSKVFLDGTTAKHQSIALCKILSDFVGPRRLPMLIVDNEDAISNRKTFAARGAGILGFSMIGYDRTFILNRDMELEIDVILSFVEKHKGKLKLIFGLTSYIWQYLCLAMKNQLEHMDLSNSVLFHGGGWKTLEKEAVTSNKFRTTLKDLTGIERVHNYFGMVEQTGSIMVECSRGYLHCSNFSDLIIRDENLEVCEIGQTGIVQLLSPLAGSYPGHSILTEDTGVLVGEDDCMCGRLGRYFLFAGRIIGTEVRGCSDAYGN